MTRQMTHDPFQTEDTTAPIVLTGDLKAIGTTLPKQILRLAPQVKGAREPAPQPIDPLLAAKGWDF